MPHIKEISDIQPEDVVEGNQEEYQGIIAT
jgi:hypothetical protein